MSKEDIVRKIHCEILKKSRGLASLLIWINWKVVENPEQYAYTNGETVFYADKYFTLTQEEQCFVSCHEVLHIALGHIARAKRLRSLDILNFDAELNNIVQDAIINFTLDIPSVQTWMRMPQVGVRFTDILNAEVLYKRPPTSWTSEELYYYLRKDRPSIEKTDNGGYRLRLPNGKTKDLIQDLIISAEGGIKDDKQANIEQDRWQRRLSKAIQGDGPSGILRPLEKEIPKSTVPWYQTLRNYLTQALSTRIEPSYSRPSRRYLSGASEFYQPGSIRQRKLKTVAFVVDTSGSIGDADLQRFIGEIIAVQKITGSDLRVIACDAEIHTDTTFNSMYSDSATIARQLVPLMKGGGGTSFCPPFELLKDSPPDVLIYLTDLYGEFPETKPRFPVIWTSTSKQSVPWGKVIYLNDFKKSE